MCYIKLGKGYIIHIFGDGALSGVVITSPLRFGVKTDRKIGKGKRAGKKS